MGSPRSGSEPSDSFRDIAGSGRNRAEARRRAAYQQRHASLIELLESAGHSIVIDSKWTKGEAGTALHVWMWCRNCTKRYRRPFHRWWGLSTKRPCR